MTAGQDTVLANAVLLNSADDVVVALADVPAGSAVRTADGRLALDVRSDVPRGHKIARRPLAAGEVVHKYGHVIGVAAADIAAGEHVHVHNLAMPPRSTRVAGTSGHPAPVPASTAGQRTFRGFVRPDGRVGTRRYLGVLTTVNCSATVAKLVARHFELHPLPNVDGVVALTHDTGCGMASQGEGWDILRRTLVGYARHVNMAGIVVVGLGCEVNTIEGFVEGLGVGSDVPVATYSIQDVGGTQAAVAKGVELVTTMAADLGVAERTEVGLGNLVLGLQCGGSDAWSGLSANPVLGYASDAIVAAGGVSILGETPEIYGAEHLLAARAVNPQVATRLLGLIDWWEDYTARNGATMDANPSAGNKAGGITTIVEKSLGAVAKAGTAPLSGVLSYAEQVPAHGLVHMDTPGYDPVSATGMVAGGATVICFTTGRGSVFGSRPTPTIKLATNSEMANRMAGDMDLDCGGVLDGTASIEQLGEQLLDLICAVASGQQTFSEQWGVGGEEIVPWHIGAVM